jgi:glutathione peroxidase
VLGFPCNQFGKQEPGSNAEILKFAQSKYNVTFPMFEKIEVNGPGACGLYQLLKAAQKDEEGNTDIGWNFTKFLVDRDGNVVARFGPRTTPEEIAKVLPDYL